jgi:hypothetical protein
LYAVPTAQPDRIGVEWASLEATGEFEFDIVLATRDEKSYVVSYGLPTMDQFTLAFWLKGSTSQTSSAHIFS